MAKQEAPKRGTKEWREARAAQEAENLRRWQEKQRKPAGGKTGRDAWPSNSPQKQAQYAAKARAKYAEKQIAKAKAKAEFWAAFVARSRAKSKPAS